MIAAGNHGHAYQIAKAAGCVFNPAVNHVISRTSQGNLAGGIIFQDYNIASVSIHAAGFEPRWLNNNMLWIAFNYPFEQLGVKKLVATVSSRNQRALDFNRKLGFKEEARISDIFPDADLVVLAMRREDCRWLKLKPRGA